MAGGIRIGTAGWSIPRARADAFAGRGSHLERYARRFTGVEINSSFHRPHRSATYRRWAEAVPEGFRFSVKLPKTVTHGLRLAGASELLAAFAEEAGALEEKWAVVLVQLPPSLAFDAALAEAFFGTLREHVPAAIACEPRHPSWFSADADAQLARDRVARVAADPVLAPGAEMPGGWPGLRYHRLHGAPRTYYSAYEEPALRSLSERLRAETSERWCIFDNTVLGAATANALDLEAML